MIEEEKHTLVTIQVTEKNYQLTVTQNYNKKYDLGHYSYVVYNYAGHIVRVKESTGSPPQGLINKRWAQEHLREDINYIERWSRQS